MLYIYTYIYTYMHTCIHTCIQIYIRVYIYSCYTYMHTCIYMYTHTYMYIYVYIYIHVYIYTQTLIHKCMYTIHIHSYIHTYIHGGTHNVSISGVGYSSRRYEHGRPTEEDCVRYSTLTYIHTYIHTYYWYLLSYIGQGQGKKASQLIEKGMQHGDWFELHLFLNITER